MTKRSSNSNKDDETKLPVKKEVNLLKDILKKDLNLPEELVSQIPVDKIKTVSVKIAEISRSPYLSPSLLKEYEKLKKGSINRIFNLIDGNAEHRKQVDVHKMDMERRSMAIQEKIINNDIKKTTLGQWLGFCLGSMGVIGAIICAFLNQPIIGVACVGLPISQMIRSLQGIRKTNSKKK